MSDYLPQVGHRVRVTVIGEGTVESAPTEPGTMWRIRQDNDLLFSAAPGRFVSFERLPDPEPAWQTGDIVRDAFDIIMCRINEGWRAVCSGRWYPHDEPRRPLTLLVRDGQAVRP